LKSIAILEVGATQEPNFKTCIDAHLRNSIILKNVLHCDLLSRDQDYIKALQNRYDCFLLPFNTQYLPFTLIEKIIEKNPLAKRVLFRNEYDFQSVSPVFPPPWIEIANYESSRAKGNNVESFFSLNLNLIIAKKENPLTSKPYECIYYSTFRENRDRYHQIYLKDRMILSTSKKNVIKFMKAGITCNFIKKLTWEPRKETLNLFKYSLYLEDEFTHTFFNNLSNRWYEAGFCNNVVFFDKNCWNTIKKSELKPYLESVEFYLVESYEDLQDKIKLCNPNFQDHLEIQKSWRKNEPALRETMLKELYEILHHKIYE